jgi:transcriptional regulator
VYVPEAFAESDREALHALMRAHAFALLVTGGDGGPVATHLPLHLDASRGPHGTLVGHLARANPQWGAFDGRTPALVVFFGPHAYVSPRWYAAARNVPTWNYVTVHATGAPRVIEDEARVRESLRNLMQENEAHLDGEAAALGAGPRGFDAIPADYVGALLRGIVAFELPIETLAGKRKLSQNKGAADRAGVVAGLRATGGGEALAIAALVEATLRPEAWAPAP